ncbi:MAG: DUF4276 family protein [Dehalococcoidia bacterium]
MKIGVVVEGASEKKFLDRVLHKYNPNVQFDVRIMKGRNKLIQSSVSMMQQFYSARYQRGFFITDLDDNECPLQIIHEFPDEVRENALKPKAIRFVTICVAMRDLEGWLLADQEAIRSVLPQCEYIAPSDTSNLNTGKLLTKLWNSEHPNTALNKISFAASMSYNFDPARAAVNSPSFEYFWKRLRSCISNC